VLQLLSFFSRVGQLFLQEDLVGRCRLYFDQIQLSRQDLCCLSLGLDYGASSFAYCKISFSCGLDDLSIMLDSLLDDSDRLTLLG